jgi:hypothetical protein
VSQNINFSAVPQTVGSVGLVNLGYSLFRLVMFIALRESLILTDLKGERGKCENHLKSFDTATVSEKGVIGQPPQ